jgi:hypothetical protein
LALRRRTLHTRRSEANRDLLALPKSKRQEASALKLDFLVRHSKRWDSVIRARPYACSVDRSCPGNPPAQFGENCLKRPTVKPHACPFI